MKITRYKFILKPTSNILLPTYKGSTFRGGFGKALRKIICQNREIECIECRSQEKCTYSYIFETAKYQKTGVESKITELPRPFFIEPPLDDKRYYTTDDRIDLSIILIGRAIEYIPYFVFAINELGKIGIGKKQGKYQKRGKYEIKKIINIGKNTEVCIYDGNSRINYKYLIIDSNDLIHEASKFNCHQIKLCFLTPTRIKYKGETTEYINFEIFIRNLFRRLSWLAEIHCNEKWDLDWKGLINRANEQVITTHSDFRWYKWYRYSQKQKKRIEMGGFVGEISFKGDLTEFLPYIKLGEYFHIGKGTVYGMGKYEIRGG